VEPTSEKGNEIKKVAIAVDNWKLKIFKKELTAAGFLYIESPGVTHDTSFLMVKTDKLGSLALLTQHMEKECSKWKKNQELN